MLCDLPEKELGIVIVRTCIDTAQGSADWYSGVGGFLTTFTPVNKYGGILESNAAGMSFIPANSTAATPVSFTALDSHMTSPAFNSLTEWALYYYANVGSITAPYIPSPTHRHLRWTLTCGLPPRSQI